MGVGISASNWGTELIKKKNPHGQLMEGGETFAKV